MEDTDFGGLARDLDRLKAQNAARQDEPQQAPPDYDYRAARAVPRREKGGASAPPDADALQRKIDHYSAQVPLGILTPRAAADFCAEAARLVGGPRAATHGDKALNFTLIADLWNGYWRMKCRTNSERVVTPFDAKDIGNMMELMKIARRMLGHFNADDYIDAAGYAGCTGEIAAREAALHDTKTP